MNLDTTWIESERLAEIQISLLRKLMSEAGPQCINLALGELGFAFPKTLAEHAIKLLEDGQPRYTANAGLDDLRDVIAQTYNTSAKCICVCNGAEEALYIALHALVNPLDKVAIPDPDYPAYPSLVNLAMGQVIRLPFAEDFCTIDWDLWQNRLQNVKILLMSTPSNPTGYCLNKSDATKLSEILNSLGIILMVDEIYKEVYTKPVEVIDYNIFDRVIRIGGLSKSHLMSGWRIGWLCSHPRLVEAATKLKQYISTCPAWLAQKLSIFALNNPQIPQDIRSALDINRRIVVDNFSDFIYHLPSATPYAMLLTTNDMQKAEDLLHKGVLTVPGSAFGDMTKDYLRINYAVPHELLKEAIRRIS